MATQQRRAQKAVDMETLYQNRLNRYVTAMQNGMPDMVPIRPFVAEFTGVYAGYTCQELSHDYELAFAAARKCAADFDWDAVCGNMVYGWMGLVQALGLKYYGIPGIDIPANTGFQYREPPEGDAFMRADEYDQLIEDPTGFLLNVWLPRVSTRFAVRASRPRRRATSPWSKGRWPCSSISTPSARRPPGCGPNRAPPAPSAASSRPPWTSSPTSSAATWDWSRTCLNAATRWWPPARPSCRTCTTWGERTADPDRLVPIGYWMHRGGVPFVSPEVFQNIYWATVKPIIEELWADGCQTLFYAEGKWDRHLESFAELPAASIVYHVDQGDIFQTHRVLGEKFCLSGGIPNYLLGIGTPEQVRQYCKKVIEGVAGNGGYVMDAGGDHPERRPGGEHPGDDRGHAGIRRLFGGPFAQGDAAAPGPRPSGRPETGVPPASRRRPLRGVRPLGGETPPNPRHPWRRGDRPADLGGHRGPGEHVHLASAGVVLRPSPLSLRERGRG